MSAAPAISASGMSPASKRLVRAAVGEEAALAVRIDERDEPPGLMLSVADEVRCYAHRLEPRRLALDVRRADAGDEIDLDAERGEPRRLVGRRAAGPERDRWPAGPIPSPAAPRGRTMMSVITSPMTRMECLVGQAIFRATLPPPPPMSPRQRYLAADSVADRAALSGSRRCCKRSTPCPCESSATRIFSGRSMAALGAASISGVPAFGLPKIRSLVGGIFSPAFSASPLWSISANSVTAFRLQDGLQFVDRLVHGVMARYLDDPFFFLHGKRLRCEQDANTNQRPRGLKTASPAPRPPARRAWRCS